MRKLLLLIVLAALLFSLSFIVKHTPLVQKQERQNEQARTQPTNRSYPVPTFAANLKRYTNVIYGFQVDYPQKSIRTTIPPRTGACGEFIRENNQLFVNDRYPAIEIDNFFVVRIIDWNKTIADYMLQEHAIEIWETQKIITSNADEAIELTTIKKPTTEGVAPMAYVHHIYKQHGKLFLLMKTQSPLNEGCISMQTISADYPELIEYRNWNVGDHFRFIQ